VKKPFERAQGYVLRSLRGVAAYFEGLTAMRGVSER
jgi:hypothetical protein